MAEQSLSFKKKKHFLKLIEGIPRDKILFAPLDISKNFHVTLFHDIDCHPLSDYFSFSASRLGFAAFTARLDQVLQERRPALVVLGMEPTGIYYEGLLAQLQQRYGACRTPRFELAIVDPAAVKLNRAQHALPCHKNDQIDAAANGELLTRGLYTPARFPSAQVLEIRELARSLHDYECAQLRLWNRLLVRVERVFPNLLLDFGAEKPLVKEPARTVLFNDLLHVCPDPYRLLALSTKEIIALFQAQGRPLGPKRAALIEQAARRALLQPQAVQAMHLQTLRQQLATLDFLKSQSAQLTQRLHELLPHTPAHHLSAMRGNSADLTLALLAALQDWQRYDTVAQIWRPPGWSRAKRNSARTAGACG